MPISIHSFLVLSLAYSQLRTYSLLVLPIHSFLCLPIVSFGYGRLLIKASPTIEYKVYVSLCVHGGPFALKNVV